MRRRSVLFALSLVLVATAYGAAPAARKRAAPRYTPTGRLLLESGGFTQELIDYPLPACPGISLGSQFGGFGLGGFWASDGSAYSMTQVGFGARPEAQLVRLRSGGLAERVGDLVRASGFALSGHTAVSWNCTARSGEVFAMDPTKPRPQWRSLASGCAASLSPDGNTVAFADGGSVWKVPAAGGTPTRLANLSQIADLGRAGLSRISRPYTTALAGDGVAALVGTPRRGFAIVVSWHGRKPQVIPLGKSSADELAWQPAGRLLAFTDYVDATQTAEVRLFDPATGSVTQVAATVNYGRGRVVWAPDGRALAVARSQSLIAFINLQGDLVGTASIGGFPDDWTA